MFNSLGDRMKMFENTFRHKLMEKSWVIIRLDGQHFKSYTKGLKKPYDIEFMQNMNQVTMDLLKYIPGAKIGYVQSDEISILLSDLDSYNTSMWFNGDINKIISSAASFASVMFNKYRPNKIATFDARSFNIPDTEILNYFIFRQQDAIRNSIQSTARTYFSHKQLENKNQNDMKQMLIDINKPWESMIAGWKYGRTYVKNVNDSNYINQNIIFSDNVDNGALSYILDLYVGHKQK